MNLPIEKRMHPSQHPAYQQQQVAFQDPLSRDITPSFQPLSEHSQNQRQQFALHGTSAAQYNANATRSSGGAMMPQPGVPGE